MADRNREPALRTELENADWTEINGEWISPTGETASGITVAYRMLRAAETDKDLLLLREFGL